MTKIIQKVASGIAYVFSGVVVASFVVTGLMALISVVSVATGLFGCIMKC